MLKHETDTEYVLLTHDPLDVQFAMQTVVLPSTGATSCFVGTTRNMFDGKVVKTLFYEAYEEMALKELVKLCETVQQQFPGVARCCMMHRLGEVVVGEASVVIAVSSEHRKEAIAACGWAIDELKARVPIWKKEIYEDGAAEWKENKEVFWTSS